MDILFRSSLFSGSIKSETGCGSTATATGEQRRPSTNAHMVMAHEYALSSSMFSTVFVTVMWSTKSIAENKIVVKQKKVSIYYTRKQHITTMDKVEVRVKNVVRRWSWNFEWKYESFML